MKLYKSEIFTINWNKQVCPYEDVFPLVNPQINIYLSLNNFLKIDFTQISNRYLRNNNYALSYRLYINVHSAQYKRAKFYYLYPSCLSQAVSAQRSSED